MGENWWLIWHIHILVVGGDFGTSVIFIVIAMNMLLLNYRTGFHHFCSLIVENTFRVRNLAELAGGPDGIWKLNTVSNHVKIWISNRRKKISVNRPILQYVQFLKDNHPLSFLLHWWFISERVHFRNDTLQILKSGNLWFMGSWVTLMSSIILGSKSFLFRSNVEIQEKETEYQILSSVWIFYFIFWKSDKLNWSHTIIHEIFSENCWVLHWNIAENVKDVS